MPAKRLSVLGCLAIIGTFLTLVSRGQNYENNLPIVHPAIQYLPGQIDDAVVRLGKELESGKVRLDRVDGFGYLPSLLKYFGMNADSQALVFSKTGAQASRVGPRNPRAIYFNDDVAIGFVRGSDVLELAALDPKQGIIFYTMNDEKAAAPRFQRQSSCLQCHQGPATAGVPGIYVGSVFPNLSGTANFRTGAIVTDHRTAFEERWGGWYVSGTHGAQRHRGNAVALDPSHPEVLEMEGTQNLKNLMIKFDTSRYLTPNSDIVALMTFEHQTQMTNLMTRVGWQTRIAQQEGKSADAVDIDEIVTYMLFAGEIPLLEPIQGVSSFTKTFPQRGPRDRRGRSLRDFDLKIRLFRYPLSYLIYSPAFDAMPDQVRARIYRRLYDVLTGKDQSDKFARLSNDDRRAILQILRETKRNLPAYFLS